MLRDAWKIGFTLGWIIFHPSSRGKFAIYGAIPKFVRLSEKFRKWMAFADGPSLAPIWVSTIGVGKKVLSCQFVFRAAGKERENSVPRKSCQRNYVKDSKRYAKNHFATRGHSRCYKRFGWGLFYTPKKVFTAVKKLVVCI